MSLAYPLLRLPCRCSLAAPLAWAVELTGRESRRELRARDWKEEVQERLIHEPARRQKKPPKRTWREELNLDLLAELGPQWWIVRVSMAPGTDYVELLTKAISRRCPELSFKIYNPSIEVKKRLKSGSIGIKSKPLYPGLVFLYCTLNKELHDFIRDTEAQGRLKSLNLFQLKMLNQLLEKKRRNKRKLTENLKKWKMSEMSSLSVNPLKTLNLC